MLTRNQHSEVDIYSPINALFGEYAEKKTRIGAVKDALDSAAMHYYFEAATARSDNRASYSFGTLFDEDAAIKALDAEFWQRTIKMTDVLDHMPAAKRNEWHEQIRKHKTPAFEPGIVFDTMKSLIGSREMFLAERVDGIFKNLSHSHITNEPQGFGKRFIMGNMRSYCSVDYRRSEYIHDLRVVIAKFMGRECSDSQTTYSDINRLPLDGKWYLFDGGAWKIRLYKKGTAHMEVHPQMAYRLNQTLAYLHPNAIPNEFRAPPKKQPKEFDLDYDLLSFKVVGDLTGLTFQNYGRMCWASNYSDTVKRVLQYIGGVFEKGHFIFDYQADIVVNEICRTGTIPEYKSHQYYPTPENIAQDAVEIAQIRDGIDICLEPSAGQGGIADYMPKGFTTCVEISKLHCEVLKAKGFNVVHNQDFLTFSIAIKFDRIVMNPPFSEGRAIAHVKHAASLLSKDGILVTVLPAGYRNKLIVDGLKHEWSEVYENEFSGTSIDTVILKLTHQENTQ
jgi:hypothetical protein